MSNDKLERRIDILEQDVEALTEALRSALEWKVESDVGDPSGKGSHRSSASPTRSRAEEYPSTGSRVDEREHTDARMRHAAGCQGLWTRKRAVSLAWYVHPSTVTPKRAANRRVVGSVRYTKRQNPVPCL